jgi:hypothetical protein
MFQDEAPNGWSRGQASRHHHAHQPHCASSFGCWKYVHHQSRRAGHEHGRTDTLQDSKRYQLEYIGSDCTQQRADGKNQKTRTVDLPPAPDVTEPSACQQQGGNGQQIDHGNPLDQRQGHMKIRHDGWKCDIYNAGVQSGHENCGGYQDKHQPFGGWIVLDTLTFGRKYPIVGLISQCSRFQ